MILVFLDSGATFGLMLSLHHVLDSVETNGVCVFFFFINSMQQV